jgi:23S rRNA pseudouridine2604 synthase
MLEPKRLSKRMSELGLSSRREADEWIERGWVRVNGNAAVLGQKVVDSDAIEVDKAATKEQGERVTVLINKPIGYVSGQAEDGYEPAVVLVRPEHRWNGDRTATRFAREQLKNLVPAGRLDIDSTGLLVLTQDGRVAKHLIGEDSAVEKEYLVRVEIVRGARLPESELRRLNHGLSLDGEALKPAKVWWQNDDQLRFVLNEGKKRQIRRMCEMVGLRVVALKRIRIGHVELGDLPIGKWRYLSRNERF